MIIKSISPETLGELRAIPGHEKYSVSRNGIVVSFVRRIPVELKPGISSNGYRMVVLSSRESRTVHSLVAAAFLGSPKGCHINHIDGNKLNNDLSNLEYISQCENNQHAVRTGLINNKGQNHGRTRLSNFDAIIIREAVSLGFSQTKIGRYLKVPIQTINGIIKRRSFIYV